MEEGGNGILDITWICGSNTGKGVMKDFLYYRRW